MAPGKYKNLILIHYILANNSSKDFWKVFIHHCKKLMGVIVWKSKGKRLWKLLLSHFTSRDVTTNFSQASTNNQVWPLIWTHPMILSVLIENKGKTLIAYSSTYLWLRPWDQLLKIWLTFQFVSFQHREHFQGSLFAHYKGRFQTFITRYDIVDFDSSPKVRKLPPSA